jgi:hypothetical protein
MVEATKHAKRKKMKLVGFKQYSSLSIAAFLRKSYW